MHKQSIKQKLLRGGAWAFAGKVAAALTGLAVNALLARLLTPEEMGAYFLTFSLVSVAAIVAQLGLTQTIVRLVAESMGTDRVARARLAVRWTMLLTVVGTLIVGCILTFGGGAWIAERLFHSATMSNVMGLAAVWMVVLAFQQLMAEIYRGFHDIRLATIFSGLITGILSMGFFLVLWWFQGHSDLHRVLQLTLVAGGSSVALSSLFLWKKLRDLPLGPDHEISVSEILSISWPLWVSNLMVFVILQADIWLVGFFLSEESVALYGAALRIVTLLMITSTIVYAVMPPIIAEMKAKNNLRELQAILTSSALGNGLIVLPVFLCFILYAAPVLGLVYGEYYAQGNWVLSILAIGMFFNVLTGMRGSVLMLTGYEKVQMKISVIGGTFNILFCSIGALNMGINGVAIGAMTGVILQCVMELIVVKRALGIWTFATPMYTKEFLAIYSK